jgi:hypothetical protein
MDSWSTLVSVTGCVGLVLPMVPVPTTPWNGSELGILIETLGLIDAYSREGASLGTDESGAEGNGGGKLGGEHDDGRESARERGG